MVSAGDDSEDGGEARLPDVKLIVDPSLSVLARKLRMVGIDTMVAGEVIKHQEEGMMISPNADGEYCCPGGSRRESLSARSLLTCTTMRLCLRQDTITSLAAAVACWRMEVPTVAPVAMRRHKMARLERPRT